MKTMLQRLVFQLKSKGMPTNRPKLSGQKRLASFFAKYGMTHEDRDAILVAQGSCCAICKSTSPGSRVGWNVDHCHVKGHVRAILCHHCNLGLGNFKDNPEILHAMIAYLEKHK